MNRITLVLILLYAPLQAGLVAIPNDAITVVNKSSQQQKLMSLVRSQKTFIVTTNTNTIPLHSPDIEKSLLNLTDKELFDLCSKGQKFALTILPNLNIQLSRLHHRKKGFLGPLLIGTGCLAALYCGWRFYVKPRWLAYVARQQAAYDREVDRAKTRVIQRMLDNIERDFGPRPSPTEPTFEEWRRIQSVDMESAQNGNPSMFQPCPLTPKREAQILASRPPQRPYTPAVAPNHNKLKEIP